MLLSVVTHRSPTVGLGPAVWLFRFFSSPTPPGPAPDKASRPLTSPLPFVRSLTHTKPSQCGVDFQPI